MKKTKILIPALGMMMLSTAAAVSGTMAWFTATRAVAVTTTDFKVEALDGSLSVAAVEGAGTDVTNTPGQSPDVHLETGVTLGDASFDHTSGNLYTDVANETTGAVESYKLIGNVSNVSAFQVGATTAYYAVTWTLNFSYDFKSDTTSRDLFFDGDNSDSVAKKSDGSNHAEGDKIRSCRGFRIAMISNEETPQRTVWAPQRGSSDTYYKDSEHQTETVLYRYVGGTTLNSDERNYTNTTTGDLICNDASGQANDSAAANVNRSDYLGTFVKTSRESISVQCVAWFEGLDPEVITGATLDKISTTMKFYIRLHAAA